MTGNSNNPVARRAFVTGLGVGAAALGAGLAACANADEKPAAAAAPVQPARWQPAREAEDDWLELPGRHRLAFDATSAKGAGEALTFVNNYLIANKDGYKLEPSALAVVVILRHFATPFAYNDAMWAKYGTTFSKLIKFTDPKTKKPPRSNLYNAKGYEKLLPNRGTTIGDLVKLGTHSAVCGMATEFFAQTIAKKTGSKPDDIYNELAANLIPNAHMVAAGIVAVNRAQERGYAFAYVG